ncbi:MAG: hypothetical protein ABR881_17215 [Candidatus Sulfotelmatobacter sp.]|jgi:hypothetical protein
MRSLLSVRGVLAAAATVTCLGAALWAQDPENPNSLGDVARQTRAQHASAPEDKSSKAQSLVDEMQQEQEAAENAPTGFKSYNAGDYRLLVPFPFSLEGRDNGGAVLLGSRLGITNTEVLAGTPNPIPANLSDNELFNLARGLAGQHGQTPYCSAIKLGQRKAFRCGWNGSPYLLGHEVWGSMAFVVGSNSLIPVMCVSPDEFQCLGYDKFGYHTCNNRNPSWDEVQKTRAAINTRFRDEVTTGQMCDQIIYPSIQLKEDIVVHPASIPEGKTPVARVSVPQDRSLESSEPQTPSLAELARQTRQAPHDKAQATLDNAEGSSAPRGFQSFSLQFCLNPQQCSEASIDIPEKAEVVSRVNGQHIFKAALDGEWVMLYAGPADVNAPYRSLTDPDYIRIRDLANSNGWSREKPDGVSTQDLTIEGRPALMTRFRYQRDQKRWWIGERVLIENRGAQFLLGCAAPEEHFADAEVLCTTLVNSLRLP